jgi:hypothetical protein
MDGSLRSKKLRQTMLFGPPNSFKTTAVITTAVYPLALVSPPGEEGWGTVPDNVKGLTSFIWEEAPTDPQSAESVKNEVESTVFKIIAGDYGQHRTLCIDGFHQLYNIYLDIATAGCFGRGEEFEAQRYGRAHQMATKFLRKVLASPMEHIIVTTWNAKEMDRQKKPGERASDVESHEWPDLPGKMAKLIVGMFSVVAFSRVTKKKLADGRLVGEWLIKPDLDVWGASVKMDPRLVSKLPATSPQNFQQLYKIIGAAQQEVEGEEDSGKVA